MHRLLVETTKANIIIARRRLAFFGIGARLCVGASVCEGKHIVDAFQIIIALVAAAIADVEADLKLAMLAFFDLGGPRDKNLELWLVALKTTDELVSMSVRAEARI